MTELQCLASQQTYAGAAALDLLPFVWTLVTGLLPLDPFGSSSSFGLRKDSKLGA